MMSEVSHISHSQIHDELCQDRFRPEVLFGNGTSGAAVPVVIGTNGLKGGQDLLHGFEDEQALTGGQESAEPGILTDDWPAGSQVTGTPLAEPASVEAHVLILRNGEFPS